MMRVTTAILMILALFSCSHPPERGADASRQGTRIADGLVRFDEKPTSWLVPEEWDESRPVLLSPNTAPFGPDPFNECRFYVADSASTTICLYDVAGTCLDTLVSRDLPRGFYIATLRDWWRLTSGVYFYRASIGDYSKAAKAIMLK